MAQPKKTLRASLCVLPDELQELIWYKYGQSYLVPEIELNVGGYLNAFEDAYEECNELIRTMVDGMMAFSESPSYDLMLDFAEDRYSYHPDESDALHILNLMRTYKHHPSMLRVELQSFNAKTAAQLNRKINVMTSIYRMTFGGDITVSDDDDDV